MVRRRKYWEEKYLQQRITSPYGLGAVAVAAALTVAIEAENQNAAISMLYEPRYRPPLPPPHHDFTLDQFTEVECREYFRFTQTEIQQILPYLRLDEIVYQHRYTATPEVAFCVLLSRLSSNKCLKDDLGLFARSRTEQSVIFNDVVTHLAVWYAQKIDWDTRRLTYYQLKSYSTYIGHGGMHIWGFVDGTFKNYMSAIKASTEVVFGV